MKKMKIGNFHYFLRIALYLDYLYTKGFLKIRILTGREKLHKNQLWIWIGAHFRCLLRSDMVKTIGISGLVTIFEQMYLQKYKEL